MPAIKDDEFGTINYSASRAHRMIRLKVSPRGELKATLPLAASIGSLKNLIDDSRRQLRIMLYEHRRNNLYITDMPIGKSHFLAFRPAGIKNVSISNTGQHIVARLPVGKQPADPDVQVAIRTEIIKALRLEAKSYLPRRLAFLAEKYGFRYEKTRFTHAASRWGSCSSNGTVSLNIALIKLPFELIDYVLLHELCHTRELNHSANFWRLVQKIDPEYEFKRAELKRYAPTI